MTIQNLAIVFGPTLFGQMMPSNGINGQMNGGMADAAFQNKVNHAVPLFKTEWTDEWDGIGD
jgi:hypothetical protein